MKKIKAGNFIALNLVFAGFLLLTACSGIAGGVKKDEIKNLPAVKIYDMGTSSYVNKEYDKALEYFQALIDIYPEEVGLVAWSYYEMGYIYYQKKDYDNASKYFKLVSVQPVADDAPKILANFMLEKINSQTEG